MPDDSGERRILLLVEYDGTDFHGFQTQANLRTVQETLEQTLGSMTGERHRVRASSRLDAGVHSRGLPVRFTTRTAIPLIGFERGLNGRLPPDIAIVEAACAPLDFDVRHSGLGKVYRYRIWNGETPSALRRRHSWHQRIALDPKRMRRAAQQLVGVHDFSSFRSTGCQAQSTIRHMQRIAVTGSSRGDIDIWVEGNAFLQHMVRIIAGTLAEVGRGYRDEDFPRAALQARHRPAAGQTAPARGLTLWRVKYDPPPFSRITDAPG